MKKVIIFCLFLRMKAPTPIDDLFPFLSKDVQKQVIPVVKELLRQLQSENQKLESIMNKSWTMVERKEKQLKLITLERDRAVAESNIYRDKLSVTHQQLKQFEGTWGKVKGSVKITEPPLPKNLYCVYNNAYDDLSLVCYYVAGSFFAGSASTQ